MLRFLLALAALLALPTPTTATVLPPLHSTEEYVADLLRANGGDSVRADSVAEAVVEYAREHSINPLLIVGIIGVENAELVPWARSQANAVGIMQIHVPTWKGRFARSCGPDLLDLRTNICYGIRILAMNLEETTTMRAALLRYNGCRSERCAGYPTLVEARVGRAVMRVGGLN